MSGNDQTEKPGHQKDAWTCGRGPQTREGRHPPDIPEQEPDLQKSNSMGNHLLNQSTAEALSYFGKVGHINNLIINHKGGLRQNNITSNPEMHENPNQSTDQEMQGAEEGEEGDEEKEKEKEEQQQHAPPKDAPMVGGKYVIEPYGIKSVGPYGAAAYRAMLTIIKCQYSKFWPSWELIPQNIRDEWFNEFKEKYCWENKHDSAIREWFELAGQDRFTNVLNHTELAKPRWMPEEPSWKKCDMLEDREYAQRCKNIRKARKTKRDQSPSSHRMEYMPLSICQQKLGNQTHADQKKEGIDKCKEIREKMLHHAERANASKNWTSVQGLGNEGEVYKRKFPEIASQGQKHQQNAHPDVRGHKQVRWTKSEIQEKKRQVMESTEDQYMASSSQKPLQQFGFLGSKPGMHTTHQTPSKGFQLPSRFGKQQIPPLNTVTRDQPYLHSNHYANDKKGDEEGNEEDEEGDEEDNEDEEEDEEHNEEGSTEDDE